ncbi:MAG: Holliday junction branch migration protein RuvA [Patescibacteria group bacterium]
MIAQLNGVIAAKTERALIVDVNGVGYEVACPNQVLAEYRLGSEVKLFTYLSVREDALDLYGFLGADDLEFFKLLLTVSGIGPKSALSILNSAQPAEIKQAVVEQNAGRLQAVQGLGKKTAEKIIHELKDKFGAFESVAGSDEQIVLQAVIQLGYSLAEARQAVRAIQGEKGTVEQKVKAALRSLSRH